MFLTKAPNAMGLCSKKSTEWKIVFGSIWKSLRQFHSNLFFISVRNKRKLCTFFWEIHILFLVQTFKSVICRQLLIGTFSNGVET